MKGFVPPDPETAVSEVRFAVVYVPRRSRKRFAKGCVDVVPDHETAIQQSGSSRNRYPAKVLGPSKSSEGQYLYYLVEWLD